MVRLDRNSKKSFKKALIIASILILLTAWSITFFRGKRTVYAEARSGNIVIELTTKEVISGSNIHAKLPMASTTKVVTAITVLCHSDPEKIITIPKEAVGIEGSSIYLAAGDKYSVKDLLYGLMLQSGNDAAVALALSVGEGSVSNFSDKMNTLAKRVGACNSNFVNPHGLHHENHYTTPYDLAVITAYAMKNSTFREIVGSKVARISDGNDGTRVIANKNKMLKEFEGGNGVKTGFTKAAGRCLVSSAKRDNLELICVVLNCPNMFGDSKAMLARGFGEFEAIKIAEKDKKIATFTSGREQIEFSIKEDIYYPIRKGTKSLPQFEFYFSKKIAGDVVPKSGDFVGYLKVYANNRLIYFKKAYSM